MLLSPPSHLGYPLPSGFSIVQNVPLPSCSVLRSLQGQIRVPKPPGASGGSLLTPGCLLAGLPSPLSRWASYNLFVQILTFRTQDSPPGHCPTSLAPHATSSATIAPAPFVQGKGAVSSTSPWPTFWASPRNGSLWLTPRPGCCHLSHPTHCPPQKGGRCQGHHPNSALPSTVTPKTSGGKEAENKVTLQPLASLGVGIGSLGLQESRLQQHSSQRHQTTQQPVHPFHNGPPSPSLD